MSHETSYQPAPGITVRQRISVKQNAKLEFQRDYTVEVAGTLDDASPFIGAVSMRDDEGIRHSLEDINRAALRRAEADWREHVDAIKVAGHA